MAETKKIISIIGPTACGKTALALKIAKTLPCHLISVDSVQVYRSLDIGSAKLDKASLKRFPHALIDICEPEESYSVAQFVKDARKEIDFAWRIGKIPVLVGGTMLYFKSLWQPMDNLPTSQPDLRQKIIADLENGAPIYQELLKLDASAISNISPNDFKRLSRLWEIYLLSGEKPSALFAQQSNENFANNLIIALNLPRQELHQNIEKRFLEMIDLGFFQEVEALFQRKNLNLDTPAIQSAGYQQLWRYFLGEYERKTAIELAIIATRQLAKRQITWLNNGLQKIQSFPIYHPQDKNIYPEIINFLQK